MSGERPGIKGAKPWQGVRPGAAASRQDAADELFTLLAFDVPCDKTRRKLTELCKDYGLKRAQWSVFEGMMTRNRREELAASIEALLVRATGGGRAAIYPIGEREAAWVKRCVTGGVKPKVASAVGDGLAVGGEPSSGEADDD